MLGATDICRARLLVAVSFVRCGRGVLISARRLVSSKICCRKACFCTLLRLCLVGRCRVLAAGRQGVWVGWVWMYFLG